MRIFGFPPSTPNPIDTCPFSTKEATPERESTPLFAQNCFGGIAPGATYRTEALLIPFEIWSALTEEALTPTPLNAATISSFAATSPYTTTTSIGPRDC